MKIQQRKNGGFVMVHNGVEAPYTVLRTEAGYNAKWSVFDADDEDCESPIASEVSRSVAEKAAIEHYQKAPK